MGLVGLLWDIGLYGTFWLAFSLGGLLGALVAYLAMRSR